MASSEGPIPSLVSTILTISAVATNGRKLRTLGVPLSQLLRELRRCATEDWPILAGAGAIWGALVLALASKGMDGLQPQSYANNLMLYLLILAVLVILAGGRMLHAAKPASPIRFLAGAAASPEFGRRLIRGIPMLTALVLFMPAFSAMKSSIPLFNSHNWDAAFIAADQAIHGDDAWRLLQPALGYPIVTSALSFAYLAWFFVVYSASIYFCFVARDHQLRAQFFITYFATWTVCGVILATVLQSVGPSFVGPLLGDHRFDEQIAYLRAANEQYPVLILRAQDFLIAARLDSSNELGAGISAMPSMHVGMATLIALSSARLSRAWGIAGYTFLATIMIGSVHLAPHYAVDGYVSVAATVALWALAGRLARIVVRRKGAEAEAPELEPGVATA